LLCNVIQFPFLLTLYNCNKIPKGLSQVVIRRRTDNTMTIGESTKEQTMNYESTTQKTTDCLRHELHQKGGKNFGAPKGLSVVVPLVT
jgi:hypothetical protein